MFNIHIKVVGKPKDKKLIGKHIPPSLFEIN